MKLSTFVLCSWIWR